MASLDEMRAIAERVLGREGRMMAMSKSRYRDRRPSNMPIFNGRVVVRYGHGFVDLWWGDLDLTLWEQRLAALARLIDRQLHLLYEHDARASYDDDDLAVSKAVASFSGTGETLIPELRRNYIVRADDGMLRFQLSKGSGKRWSWRLLAHRPRLWRVWVFEMRRRSKPHLEEARRYPLIYIGRRDSGRSPLLVLGVARFRGRFECWWSCELTWYPANRDRHAPRPLLHVTPKLRTGRRTWWLRLLIWPGSMYAINGGVRRWFCQ